MNMKKALSWIIITTLSLWTITYAMKSNSQYETALNTANQYIIESTWDEFWEWNSPKISWEWKYFYTDKKTPSYVEFKVSCKDTKDCWFIMVNIDWDDVTIPVSSSSWSALSEVLSSDTKWENKFYYFSPLSQFWENKTSWEVKSINPQDYIQAEAEIKNTSNSKKELKTNESREANNKELSVSSILKSKLEKAKASAKEFKKSNKFKEIKAEIEKNKLTNNTEEYNSKTLNMRSVSPWSETIWNAVYVKWSSTSMCGSRIPCYKQFKWNYDMDNGDNCDSGCSPTAMAMIYWYYDRNNIFPDLVSGIAKDYIDNASTNSNITNLINAVREDMKTRCKLRDDWLSSSWPTSRSNIKKAIQYAKDKWYSNSVSFLKTDSTIWLFGDIIHEIARGRPVIIHTETHTLVAYWYKKVVSDKMIRVNYWWWRKSHATVDVNMDAININWKKRNVEAITTIEIKN